MTLDEIIEVEFKKWYGFGRTPSDHDIPIRRAMTEYARSIIPAKQEACNLNDNCNICQQRIGFNTCRTQMLSRIEEDSK